MRAGLEVHQQLATGKLFCACPSEFSEEVEGSFARRLRAASGESRSVDPAAALQAERGLIYRYESGPANCLVEMDEEPPHPINPDALDTALTLALLLGAHPLDEIVVMRKIVVDGSNTSGFQRTALVAVDGHLELEGKHYSIPTICLEEDAARKVGESGGEVVYRLDRLGIPLVEISTGPEITDGREGRAVAEELGALLRATRAVRRGIGTIREDVNVSIEGGHRIEIKGVQELRRIQQYIDSEVERQRVLLRVRDELVQRGANPPEGNPLDVTPLFAGVTSGPLSSGARKGGPVLALRLPGFAGALRSPPGTEERLGRELADQARSVGLRGLLHSDELPGHGVDDEGVARVREQLHLEPDDAFVLVADRDPARAELALRRVAARAAAALEGIPGETRDPLPDGRTRYSRPLPGRDRMYPETDIPPIAVTAEWLARLGSALPERPGALRARLRTEYGLSAEVAGQLVGGGLAEAFELLARRGRPPGIVARLLTQDLPTIPPPSPDAAAFEPSVDLLDELILAAEAGRFAKEGIPAVLTILARGAASLEEAVERAGLSGLSDAELEAIVERIVRANARLLAERGDAAFSPLMGDVMREVRGRRDGKVIADVLRRSMERARGTR